MFTVQIKTGTAAFGHHESCGDLGLEIARLLRVMACDVEFDIACDVPTNGTVDDSNGQPVCTYTYTPGDETVIDHDPLHTMMAPEDVYEHLRQAHQFSALVLPWGPLDNELLPQWAQAYLTRHAVDTEGYSEHAVMSVALHMWEHDQEDEEPLVKLKDRLVSLNRQAGELDQANFDLRSRVGALETLVGQLAKLPMLNPADGVMVTALINQARQLGVLRG